MIGRKAQLKKWIVSARDDDGEKDNWVRKDIKSFLNVLPWEC